MLGVIHTLPRPGIEPGTLSKAGENATTELRLEMWSRWQLYVVLIMQCLHEEVLCKLCCCWLLKQARVPEYVGWPGFKSDHGPLDDDVHPECLTDDIHPGLWILCPRELCAVVIFPMWRICLWVGLSKYCLWVGLSMYKFLFIGFCLLRCQRALHIFVCERTFLPLRVYLNSFLEA